MLYETVLDRRTYELLKEYCTLPFLSNFSLAGGTALALRLGHRISYDIDLFSNEKVDVHLLNQELDSFYGLDYTKRGNLSNALFATVKSIKSDFVFDYAPRIKEIEKVNHIRLYSVEDNIAMKLNAICGRGRKRDFYDLYFILKHFTIQEITEWFVNKFGEERLMMLFKSVTYFEDAENDEEPVLLQEKPSWMKVKKSILKAVKIIR